MRSVGDAHEGFDAGSVTEKVFELASTGMPFSESVEQIDRELGGYTAGSKVYKTTNGGSSWTNLSDNLPNMPIHCVVGCYRLGRPWQRT